MEEVSNCKERLLDFYSVTRQELGSYLEKSTGLPAWRASQIFDWVYKKNISNFSEMSNIRKDWRERFKDLIDIRSARLISTTESQDGSCKYLIEVSPGIRIEAVFIRQEDRNTICLSSQFGCAMGCSFCRTSTMGLKGNLSAGDIVRQLLLVSEDAARKGFSWSNVVFMGMGEPLHNLDSVLKAIKILTDDHAFKLGPRKITVSTCGLVPGMKRLGQEGEGVNLAVSLNATTDSVREAIMPVNKQYPLKSLLQALREYPLKPRRKITIEYVMLKDVNDKDSDLKRLVRMMTGMKVKINLIPYNSGDSKTFEASSDEWILHWCKKLNKARVQTTIRWSKGADALAACGQLAVK